MQAILKVGLQCKLGPPNGCLGKVVLYIIACSETRRGWQINTRSVNIKRPLKPFRITFWFRFQFQKNISLRYDLNPKIKKTIGILTINSFEYLLTYFYIKFFLCYSFLHIPPCFHERRGTINYTIRVSLR